MFRFVVYKNSVLATICSFFGSAFIAMSIFSMFSRELGILEGIGMIAAGLGLMWLGHVISDRKERKKQAKAANAAQNTSFNSNTYTQPNKATANTANVVNDSVMHKKPVKISPVLAAIFFLLAALFGLWSAYLYAYQPTHDPFLKTGWGHVVVSAACMLLMIGYFRSRKTQAASVLQIAGFLGVIVGNAAVALRCYRVYGLAWYTSNYGVYATTYVPLFKIAVFFLMFLFAIFAMNKAKARLGGIVRVLWIVPALFLLLVTTKIISDNRSIDIIQKQISIGSYMPRGDVMESVSNVFLNVAIFFGGFALKAICKKPAVSFRQTSYVQPEVQYTAPVQPVQKKLCSRRRRCSILCLKSPRPKYRRSTIRRLRKSFRRIRIFLTAAY